MKGLLVLLVLITGSSGYLIRKADNDPLRPALDHERTARMAAEAFSFCKKNDFNQQFVLLADMRLHSGVNRLVVWDFKTDSIRWTMLVGHGCGEYPWGSDHTKENPLFSNVPESHCSSLGKYRIGERGYSSWGIGIKYLLYGLESTNSKALARTIVLHGWDQMEDTEPWPKGSPEGWGCPTVSNSSMRRLDSLLKLSERPVLLWMYQ